jgi:hypothetical protein
VGQFIYEVKGSHKKEKKVKTTLGTGASCANCGSESPRKFSLSYWFIWACGAECARKASLTKVGG